MKDLGVGTFRFSVSWARVMPDGRTLNEDGLAFYERLGAKVGVWTTLNEPWCSSLLSYAGGEHAPAHTDPGEAVAAVHHLLLAHGLGVKAIREAAAARSEEPSIGITLNFTVAHPADPSNEADLDAARRIDGTANRLFLDPIFRGAYPEDVVADMAATEDGDERCDMRTWIHVGDLEIINAPIEVLGVNFYNGQMVAAADPEDRSPLVRIDKRGRAHLAAVERAVKELGYVPNSAARMLVTQRTDTVALMIPEPDLLVFTDPFFARIAICLSRVLAASDIQLVTAFADSANGSKRAAAFLRDGRVDGAIVVSHHRIPEQLDSYLSAPLPVVFIGRPFIEDPPPCWVDVDNLEVGRIAARRLIEAGVKRPAIITGPLDMVAASDRLLGFRELLSAQGMVPFEAEARFTPASGEAAADELAPLITAGDIDGVFVSSDRMALAAMRVWKSHGIRIPEDLRVIGFDGTEAAAEAIPALTTIDNPAEEMGRAAARMLREMSDGTWNREPILLPTRLIARESC